MNDHLKKNKVRAYCQLTRINKPIGALLLLWPTMWALWLVSPDLPPMKIVLTFITGVFLMRSAGCVLNDYVDRNFDGHVKRTANRPIPSGKVNEKSALKLFAVLVFCSFLLVTILNNKTKVLSLVGLILACCYPFMKRYTYFPQLILGITFSWSIPMVFSAVSQPFSISCWLAFLANTLWVIAYDTQYALADRNEDISIGIKSTAILFGYYDRLIIIVLQASMIGILICIGYLNSLNSIWYFSVLLASSLFVFQDKLIAQGKYIQAFERNNYIGLVLFLGLVGSYVQQSYF